MLIVKRFEDLRVGDKFYPIKNGAMSIKFRCVKVGHVESTSDIILRYSVTQRAFEQLAFNCVILESTNNVNGFYHFLNDEDPVSSENSIC